MLYTDYISTYIVHDIFRSVRLLLLLLMLLLLLLLLLLLFSH